MGSYSAEMESLFNDWDLKEQEDLCIVEKLLVQAADILEVCYLAVLFCSSFIDVETVCPMPVCIRD